MQLIHDRDALDAIERTTHHSARAVLSGWSLTGQALFSSGDTDDILRLAGAADSAIDLSTIGDAGNANAIFKFENFIKQGGSNGVKSVVRCMCELA